MVMSNEFYAPTNTFPNPGLRELSAGVENFGGLEECKSINEINTRIIQTIHDINHDNTRPLQVVSLKRRELYVRPSASMSKYR